MACSNHPTSKNMNGIRSFIAKDPFKNPANKVVQWTRKRDGQINQKIVKGPDKGVHRYYNPGQRRSGQTGFRRGQKI